jgi:hypothetical protein
MQYIYQLRATLGNSVTSGSQRRKESTCNDIVAIVCFKLIIIMLREYVLGLSISYS